MILMMPEKENEIGSWHFFAPGILVENRDILDRKQ